MTSICNQILNVARERNQTVWDTCQHVLEFILEQDESVRETFFSTFLAQVNIEDVADFEDGQESYFSEDALDHMKDIDDVANRIFEGLFREQVSKESFYEMLWKELCDSLIFHDRLEQAAFLEWLWVNPCIPYYYLGEGCKMSDEAFCETIKKILPEINQARFLLSAPLAQKTQRASLLIKLADGLCDESEKIVFWACVVSQSRVIGSLEDASE